MFNLLPLFSWLRRRKQSTASGSQHKITLSPRPPRPESLSAPVGLPASGDHRRDIDEERPSSSQSAWEPSEMLGSNMDGTMNQDGNPFTSF